MPTSTKRWPRCSWRWKNPNRAYHSCVGSYRFDGVTFRVYPEDHKPPHVHGRYQGVVAVLELGKDRIARLSERYDAIRPAGAKRNQVRHIVNIANAHFDDLMELWEEAHA